MSRVLGVCLLMASLCGCPVATSAPCTTDSECPAGRCRLGGCEPSCLDDTECPTGKTCLAGACLERAECAATADCTEGFTCSAGWCLCSSDAACATNQVCRQGRCEERGRCTADRDCPLGQHCEVTLGSCLPACNSAANCAPGLNPQLADVLFVCQDGACLRRCIADALCGGQGLICEAGLCTRADCATLTDCPLGQYCTSAITGRCREYRACGSTAECPDNTYCQAFSGANCPPGLDCAQKICQELPRCLLDTDCPAPAYCQQGFCQPSTACPTGGSCPTGQVCVDKRCVPGGCRGHDDCPLGQACTAGACRSAPAASEIVTLVLSPLEAVLPVGGQVQLSLVAFTFSGESFPLAAGSYSVVDSTGAPSDAATVTPSGVVTAEKPGVVRVLAGVSNPGVRPVEATLTLLPSLSQGRRVTVVDATTGGPLAGVAVHGCNGPLPDAPCPAPITVTTDASGAATFPTFTAITASFSAVSPELRGDGFPRYERVSVAMTAARDLLLPLGENPVHGAAGFNAGIHFSSVHSSGPVWLGFAVLSVGDPADLDMTTLFGEPFHLTVLNTDLPVSLPGSTVLYFTIGDGASQEHRPIKHPVHSLGLGQPGRRAFVAFAGKADWAQASRGGTLELLPYTSAMDYALQGFTRIPVRPRVPDTRVDLDSDGLCELPIVCPRGSEDIPDYFRLPGFTVSPRREQLRRTEVVLPNLPVGLDTAIISAVQISNEMGLVPLGFSSQTGELPLEDGTRPLSKVLLRSGAPYGGVETGTPGIWVFATQIAKPRGDMSGRIIRGHTLPTQVEVPDLLPLPSASYAPAQRTLTPVRERWSSLASQRASLARVTFTSTRGRHVVLFPLRAGLPALRIPEAPAGGGEDPADQEGATVEVTALALSADVTPEELLDLPRYNLQGLSSVLEAYARARAGPGGKP